MPITIGRHADPLVLGQLGGLQGAAVPVVDLAAGAGQADRPDEDDALAVGGGQELAGGEGGLGGQFGPEGGGHEVRLALLLQFQHGRLQAVALVGVDADEPRLVQLADGDAQ
jgi:hypothetical protein